METTKAKSRATTSRKGKAAEHFVISKLLKHGLDPYVTVADDQGIDCVIRIDSSTYVDIQVKSRSREAWFIVGNEEEGFERRKNYWLILHVVDTGDFWIIPSLEINKPLANIQANGKNKGDIVINASVKCRAAELERYHNEKGWDLLANQLKNNPDGQAVR